MSLHTPIVAAAAADVGVVEPSLARRKPAARLSALEWSVVAMAEQDGIESLREPGRRNPSQRRAMPQGTAPR